MKSGEGEREKKLDLGVPRGFIYVFAGGEGEVGIGMMRVMTMAILRIERREGKGR